MTIAHLDTAIAALRPVLLDLQAQLRTREAEYIAHTIRWLSDEKRALSQAEAE